MRETTGINSIYILGYPPVTFFFPYVGYSHFRKIGKVVSVVYKPVGAFQFELIEKYAVASRGCNTAYFFALHVKIFEELALAFFVKLTPVCDTVIYIKFQPVVSFAGSLGA